MTIAIQQQASKMTARALDAILRSCQHLPESRLDWVPEASARTARDQIAECVQSAERMCDILNVDYFNADFFPQHFDQDALRLRRLKLIQDYPRFEELADLARARYAELCRVIESLPDSRLEHIFELPWGAGQKWTGADLLFLAYWNLTYHLGQINYIQMLLGDTEMH